jgi:hypothetical protein
MTSTPPNAASTARPHKAPEETAHMNVLGRDGSDLDSPAQEATAEESSTVVSTNDPLTLPASPLASRTNLKSPISPASTATNLRPNLTPTASNTTVSTNNNWWGKMPVSWMNSSPEEDTGEADYQAFDGGPAVAASSGRPLFHPLAQVEDTPSTVEDQLRQDCSFFYKGMEDMTPRKMRTMNSYTAATPRMLSSRDGAMFHAKYERLNQNFVVDDDLRFEEELPEASLPSDVSRNVMDVGNSSLFFEQDGRLLMRLPRDQVRLVMDHDLEAGIVAVEQWRKEETPLGQKVEVSVFENTPRLRYVLTVPDDLYRRIVSEMSDALVPPYLGLFKCCSETERADIKLACAVLFVVFGLMFISTLEYKEE